jgi:hypothetical protein
MTQPENNAGNSAVQLTHVTRTYKHDEFEVRALDDVPSTFPANRSWRSAHGSERRIERGHHE